MQLTSVKNNIASCPTSPPHPLSPRIVDRYTVLVNSHRNLELSVKPDKLLQKGGGGEDGNF